MKLRQKALISSRTSLQAKRLFATEHLASPLTVLDALIADVEGHPTEFGEELSGIRRSEFGRVVVRLLARRGPSEAESNARPGGPAYLGPLTELAIGPGAWPKPDARILSCKRAGRPQITLTVPPLKPPVRQLAGELGAFHNWLREQREWLGETLRSTYEFVAAEQQAFIETLNPFLLVPMPLESVSRFSQLGYSPSTYSRVLGRRTVEIISSGSSIVLPARFLVSTAATLRQYAGAYWVNGALKHEVGLRSALSDEGIAQWIRQRNGPLLARRTIARYRGEAEIPPQSERDEAFRTGRNEAFAIHFDWEPWLPEQVAATPLDSAPRARRRLDALL